MIATVDLSQSLMLALVDRMGEGGAGRVRLYTATSAMVADVILAQPAGTVSAGVLTLDPSLEAVALVAAPPRTAVFSDGNGVDLFSCAARLGGEPDLGQPVVVGGSGATAVTPGVVVQILSGGLTLLP